jgi:hypothetical protein
VPFPKAVLAPVVERDFLEQVPVVGQHLFFQNLNAVIHRLWIDYFCSCVIDYEQSKSIFQPKSTGAENKCTGERK